MPSQQKLSKLFKLFEANEKPSLFACSTPAGLVFPGISLVSVYVTPLSFPIYSGYFVTAPTLKLLYNGLENPSLNSIHGCSDDRGTPSRFASHIGVTSADAKWTSSGTMRVVLLEECWSPPWPRTCVGRRGLASAGIPAILESVGLDRGNGRDQTVLTGGMRDQTLFPYRWNVPDVGHHWYRHTRRLCAGPDGPPARRCRRSRKE